MSRPTAGSRPPSPPHSNDGDFNGRAHGNSIVQDPFTPPRSIRPTSQEPVYEHYGDPSSYPIPLQPIYYSPELSEPTFVRHMGPRTTPIGNTTRTTRSGRTLGSPMNDGNLNSSRSKRSKKLKAHKAGTPLLSAPLSELTKDSDIPVRDMGAWVHRPREERMQEVEKKKGYVTRPMNSFMLYRSAYADRVKQYCDENNHQAVSKVTGASWPMEPKAIREMYEQYAIVERDNHAAANPDYKFAPNKGKKRDFAEDSDSDGEWGGSRSIKRSRRSVRDDTRSRSGTPFKQEMVYPMQYHTPPPVHRSSYQANNPHGAMPFNYASASMGGYYQPQLVPYSHNIEDIRFERLEHPYPPLYDMNPSLIGMPDGSNNGLLQISSSLPVQEMPMEQMVDPRLSQLDPSYTYTHFDGPEDVYQTPRTFGYASYPQQGLDSVHPGVATFTDVSGSWRQSEEPGSDFDRELQGL